MSPADRGHELIQKHLDSRASESELSELEGLLTTDPEVADAFADAARLHAGLQGFFRQQYKIDQVADLLNAPKTSSAPPAEGSNGNSTQESGAGNSAAFPLHRGSTFVPRYAGRIEPPRSRFARTFGAVARRWKRIAAAMILLTVGVGIWSSIEKAAGRPRLVSGRLAVAGRAVAAIPENLEFEVMGPGAAVIEMPGGARIELVAQTRAAIGRGADRSVVRLFSGGGDFRVVLGQMALRVETIVGAVMTTDGRFSLDLVTMSSDRFSSTEPIKAPRLAIAVASGSVTVEHAGVSSKLSAGERREFFEPA